MGKVESERRRTQRNTGTLPGSNKRTPLLVQSQEYNNYNSQTLHPGISHVPPASYSHTMTSGRIPKTNQHPTMTSTAANSGTLTINNNRVGTHLVNGKLYAAKPNYIINSRGHVVNRADGEVMHIQQALNLGIVQKLPDNEHQAGQSYVPASNMMFNRVSSLSYTLRWFPFSSFFFN